MCSWVCGCCVVNGLVVWLVDWLGVLCVVGGWVCSWVYCCICGWWYEVECVVGGVLGGS